MNTQELQAELTKRKRQLANADEEQKEFLQKKIDGIEAELAKNAFKEDVAKEKDAPKVKGKVKKTKIVGKKPVNSKSIKAKFNDNWVTGECDGLTFEAKLFDNGSEFGINKGRVSKLDISDKGKTIVNYDRGWDIRPTKEYKSHYDDIMKFLNNAPKSTEREKSETKETHKKLSPNHELHKLSDTVYTVKNTKTDKAEFDIEKKGDGWHVECLTKEKITFKTLDEAIIHVSKQLSKGAYKQIIEQKKKALIHSRNFRAKHPSGKTTPAQDVAKAVSKATEKIKEKDNKGESIEKQVDAIVNQIIDLLKTLKELGAKSSDLNKIKKAI